jgi:4-diphosphocytidyl-2-C-methyl-D-erythritol kinase
MSSDMRVRAFAKINRSLRVLGTRADGYHELRTMFQSIGLHDTLTIRAVRGPFRLTCDDPACPTDGTNLIAKAAAAMWTAAGRRGAPRDVAIDLRKRIPMQAGLGGGSSDGAAALRVLGKRWRVPCAKIREAAGALGADVPYFLEGGAMLGLERGDLLFRLAEPTPSWVVLVLPDFGISTRDAFGWFDAQGARGFQPSGRRSPQSLALHQLVNDLEAPVAARHPEIGRIISALRGARASQAAMSGTGSAVFGLFSSRPAAIRAQKRLNLAGRRTLVTRTLSRKIYQTLAAT